MCKSSAYLITKGIEQKIMDYCIAVIPESDGKILLTDLLGEQKIVDGVIKEIMLLENKIVLQGRN